MKSRIGAFALSLFLVLGVACSKPSQQTDNNVQPPDNSQAECRSCGIANCKLPTSTASPGHTHCAFGESADDTPG